MPRVRLAGAASPQTRQMRCWPSSERTTNPRPPQAAGLALSVARPLPTKTASLGFGGSPVRAVIKTSISYFWHFCMGWYHYPRAAVAVSEQPGAGLFQQKKRLSQVGALRRRTRCSLLHTALFGRFYVGVVSLPRRALHAVETLDARGSRRLIRRFMPSREFALCGLNIPSGTRHPISNLAHSSSRRNTGRFHRLRHRQGR